MRVKESFRIAAVSAAAAVLVAACGGGGGSAAPAAAPVAGTSVGVLSDSPIEGVEYTTSGGYTGLTDANGNYNYNPGETVTFRIGAITLGTVTATGTVTPLELAAGEANKVTNLLVLLQSLDSDGDPTTRITITAAARTAAASISNLDLTVAPATFASSTNTALTTLIAAAETTNTAPVSPSSALLHFRDQFFQQLKGGWIAVDENNDVVVLRFEQNGTYAIGETGTADSGGHPGIETGTLVWDPANGQVSISGAGGVDGNGDWGLSSAASGDTMGFDGDTLVYREAGGETFTFSRVTNDPEGIVGMWTLNDPSASTPATDAKAWQTFVFFANGRYMMIDPVGDEDTNCPGIKGLEFGLYSVESGRLKVTSAPAYDQNSCAGLWDQPASSGIDLPITFSSDKLSFTIDGRTLFRISR